jgi:hypothetical protein
MKSKTLRMTIMKAMRVTPMRKTRSQNPWSRRADDYEALLKRVQHRFDSSYCQEPRLRFAGDQVVPNPKRGIADFGPLEEFKTRPVIRIGVIGTPASVDGFSSYMQSITRNVSAGTNARNKQFDPVMFPDFPGIDPGSAFGVEFRNDGRYQRLIPEKLLEQDLVPASAADQLRNVVARIASELSVLADLDPQPEVVAIVMPPLSKMFVSTSGKRCGRRPAAALTPAEAFEKTMAKEAAKSNQGFLDFGFVDGEPKLDRGFWNFHHALKARTMKLAIPTQLIWERSLTGEQTTQDPASIAWNLVTGLYYKAGNIPWEVEGLPYDTCFIGVSFFKDGLHAGAGTHTSLAQVFSGHGEGLVMKGGKAVKKPGRSAYMDKEAARRLVSEALGLYGAHHPGGKARRVVIHKTSPFTADEMLGVEEALESGMKLDLVSMTHGSDLRFLRPGVHPPLRGHLYQTIGPRDAFVHLRLHTRISRLPGREKSSADPDPPSTRGFNEGNDLRGNHGVDKAQLEFLLLRREASDNRALRRSRRIHHGRISRNPRD